MRASRVEPLGQKHIQAVAELHGSSLPDSLLARFGARALRTFYEAALGSPFACGFVVEDEDVLGFVFGSTEPMGLRRQIFGKRPIALPFALATGVLRRPTVLSALVASLRGPTDGSFDAEAPELTYLAVAPEARRSGAGRRLVQAFGRALADRGVEAYELSVESENVKAATFYETLGFEQLGTYREAGTTFLRLRFDLERLEPT